MSLKCLRCGSECMVELNPTAGTTYALSIINENKTTNQVQPVRVIVCQSCKKIDLVLSDS